MLQQSAAVTAVGMIEQLAAVEVVQPLRFSSCVSPVIMMGIGYHTSKMFMVSIIDRDGDRCSFKRVSEGLHHKG